MTRRGFGLTAAGAALAAGLHAAPNVCVRNVRRAFHNGEHNAFTDLTWFQGRIYLTFRSCPDGHMIFPTSTIRVLESEDLGQNWREVHHFSAPKRDVRDPHFLVFDDKLFVYSGTWYCGDGPPKQREANQMLGYAAVSRDGRSWDGPYELEGTYGHYIWRAAAFAGRAYLCGRRKRSFAELPVTSEEGRRITESVMLESEDGLRFRTAGFFQKEWGNETAFQIASDGAVTAVARTIGKAQLCRSLPPYDDWTRKELNRHVGGPLLARWQGRYLVGGRHMTDDQPPVTTLYWLENDDLEEIARLPSGGDNSYPGLVERPSGDALVSWYSTHEKDSAGKPFTAIYLAELSLGACG
ncbi:MAG: hypothetical protein R2748_03990 [Bryobacterales bacterium]